MQSKNSQNKLLAMDKDLHNIDDLFRSGLEDHEEMPSAKVWKAVDQRLDKDTVVTVKKKYKTLKKFSLLLLLLLIGLSIYELSNRYTSGGIAKTNNIDTGKTTAPGNDDSNKKQNDKDSIASKDQIDIKNGSLTKPDSLPDNPQQSDIRQKKDNKLNTSKQHKKEFLAAAKLDNPPISEIYPDVIKITDRQKTKPGKDAGNLQKTTTTDVSENIDSPLRFKQPFTLLHDGKINKLSNDAAEREKLLHLIASINNNPFTNNKATALQQARKNPVKPSRFSLSGFFSPDIASYRLEDEDIPNQPDNSEDIKRTERHEFSSTSGLLIEYAVNKQWTIQSGITFSNTNIAVEPRTIYAQTNNNGDVKYRLNISSGYAYLVPSFQPLPVLGDSVKVTAITHKLRYLGVPVAVKYSIISGKLKIEAMAGVTTNFLTMGKLETEIQKGPNNEIDILNKIEGLKSIYLSGQAGIGAEYKLAGKVSFILMPTARFALMPINKGSVVKTFPYSFGLASGLKIRF